VRDTPAAGPAPSSSSSSSSSEGPPGNAEAFREALGDVLLRAASWLWAGCPPPDALPRHERPRRPSRKGAAPRYRVTPAR
jgi:hypothetical protein